MPFRAIPDSSTSYALLSFDSAGQERTGDPDGRMSEKLLEMAASGEYTNIFWFSHGWMGDIPAAVRQYDLWIKSFDTLTPDRRRAAQLFPGFRPLYIGLHWPSLPWGDEELRGGSFAALESAAPEILLDSCVERLGNTPRVREAVETILADARHNAACDELPDTSRQAFRALDRELGFSGSPDTDGLAIDPDAMFLQAEEASFAGGGGPLMDMLRTLSYWSMKKLGRKIGEGSLHRFLNAMERATESPIHLMGHSFGCVVISSTLGGPSGVGTLRRPVESAALVQGAVSLWSYAPSIPYGGGPGYFHDVLPSGKVSGPLITTRSRFDKAVNTPYRLATQVSGGASFEAVKYPRYGAIGRYGLQGLPQSMDQPMRPATEPYAFERSKVYNLEASEFICKMEGASGAHNDIGGPEVAHAIWEAALASAGI